MENFESLALNGARHKPKVWLKYVDDTFVIWPHGKDKLKEFLNYLNSIEDYIKFTMELEANKKLLFLDVLVETNESRPTYSVYRKATHTDKYLTYLSNHHQSVKLAVAASLFGRARDICDNNKRRREFGHLSKVLEENGYHLKLINRVQRKILQSNNHDDESVKDKYRIVVLPFVPGLSNKISRILNSYEIKFLFLDPIQHFTI
ncbi:Uncharacterised protein r2_g809 [Pycnogonum litorale]